MLNVVNICGRLTATPELKTTQSGISFVSFTVAVDANTKEKRTEFLNCIAWKGTAEFISKYFNKGKMIIVNGRLQSRSYDTQNGDKRYVTEIVVEQAFFAGDNHKTVDNTNNSVANCEFADITENDGELPF